MRCAEQLRRAGPDQPGPPDQPTDPGVRAAARLQRRPVDAEVLRVVVRRRPASGPASPAAAPVLIVGSRRTTVCPASASSADDRVDGGQGGGVGAHPGQRRAGADGDPQRPTRAAAARRAASPAITACATTRSATVVARAPLTAMPDQSSAPMLAGHDARPGLERDETAGGRGEPQRAHPVVAVGQRHGAGGHRGRTAARGARRRPRGVPGVAGDRAGSVGHGIDAELGRAGDAHDHRAGGAQPGHDRVVGRGGALGAGGRAVGARPRRRRRRCP